MVIYLLCILIVPVILTGMAADLGFLPSPRLEVECSEESEPLLPLHICGVCGLFTVKKETCLICERWAERIVYPRVVEEELDRLERILLGEREGREKPKVLIGKTRVEKGREGFYRVVYVLCTGDD